MSTKINYQPVIDAIIKAKSNKYVLTQDKMKRLCNAELPKSMFNKSYFKKPSNSLIRFLIDNDFEVSVIKPQIIIVKRGN